MNKPGVSKKCEEIYEKIKDKYRVKLDVSSKTPGHKFYEYELKGVPLRVEVGPKDLENNQVTIVFRNTLEKIFVPLDEFYSNIDMYLNKIHKEMYKKALRFLKNNTFKAENYDELKDIISSKKGYIKMMWCGNKKCEEKIKEETHLTLRCLPFNQEEISDVCPVCGKKTDKMALFAKEY